MRPRHRRRASAAALAWGLHLLSAGTAIAAWFALVLDALDCPGRCDAGNRFAANVLAFVAAPVLYGVALVVWMIVLRLSLRRIAPAHADIVWACGSVQLGVAITVALIWICWTSTAGLAVGGAMLLSSPPVTAAVATRSARTDAGALPSRP